MILLAGGGKITEPVSQKTTEIQIFDWISQPPSSDTSKRDQSYRTDSDLTGLERLEANSAEEELSDSGTQPFSGVESGTENVSEAEEKTGKSAGSENRTIRSGSLYGNLLLNTAASDIIWNYLKMKGWTDTAIAGALGNFHQESGLDPGKVENNGIGYGIGQWSFDRRVRLEAYASWRNLPVNHLLMQLDYLTEEPGESSFVKRYMKTDFPSVESAVRSWNNNWERPDREKAHLEDVRIPYAEAYYDYYTGQSGMVASYYQWAYAGNGIGSDPAHNRKTGLVSDENGLRYRYSNGEYASGVWKVIDGEHRFFGLDGYLVSDTAKTATVSDATVRKELPENKISE